MDISTKELPEAITEVLYAGLVPFVKGSPGIGKSEIFRQVADSLNLELIDIRLAQMDPTDLVGFPSIANGKTSFIPPSMFPIEGDPIPKGKDGWLVLLDELTSASQAVVAAAYKLILDRMVGQHKLHKNVVMGAAGNKSTDKAITVKMSTAMQSRLIHFNLVIDPKQWLIWANENNLDYRMVAFLEFRKPLVHAFKPDHTEDSYPCPRTWEFVSKLIKSKKKIDFLTTKIISGAVGEGAAREFKGYTEIFDSLPKTANIIANPTTVAFNQSPDVLYAITGLIAHEVNKSNIAALMQFVDRLPLDFQIITWISSIKRNKEIYDLPAIKEWIAKNAKDVVF